MFILRLKVENMAYSAKNTSQTDKFNGIDFIFWKEQVVVVLQVHKLNRVIDGTSICPIQEIGIGGQPLLNEEGLPTQQVAIQEWNDKDIQAQDLFFSTIYPGIIPQGYMLRVKMA
jgi:hypothetical protein